MENDDQPVGQLLNRRDALKLLGMGGAVLLASCAAPSATSTLLPTLNATSGVGSTQAPSTASAALNCVVRPELTIGPYFVDNQLNRSNIRFDPIEEKFSEGRPLTLKINVSSI